LVNVAQAAPRLEMLQENRYVRGEGLGMAEEIFHGVPREDQLRQQVIRRSEREFIILRHLAVRVE
jgi:hypothetical protein